jgi:two-component system OmpR family sensor kinase
MHVALMDRWSRVSLRSKITGVTVLMLTLGLLVSGVGTMVILRNYVVQQVDAGLLTEAQTTASDYTNLADNMGDSDYFVAVFDQNGALKARNWPDRPHAVLPDVMMSLDLQSVSRMEGSVQKLTDVSGDIEYHAVALPFAINSAGTFGTLLMAVSLEPAKNTVSTYLSIFLGFGVGVVVVAALLTRLLVTTAAGGRTHRRGDRRRRLRPAPGRRHPQHRGRPPQPLAEHDAQQDRSGVQGPGPHDRSDASVRRRRQS